MEVFILVCLAILFICFAGISVLSSVLYRFFPYRKDTLVLARLPRWERWCLYFIAAYPTLSLIGVICIVSIDGQAEISHHPLNPLNRPSFFYIQTLLCGCSIAVCQFLYNQRKSFRLLYIPAVVAGVFFFFAAWYNTQ